LKPSHRLVFCLVFACALAAGAGPARSESLGDLRSRSERSALVFRGVVSGLEYETDADSGLPFTYATFRQVEPILDRTDGFRPGTDGKLRIRVFGGLREDGRMTVRTDLPRFELGGAYLIFYTAGEWDFSPVVDGERGVLRIRRTALGQEMLIDHTGSVVVGMEADALHTRPLADVLAPEIRAVSVAAFARKLVELNAQSSSALQGSDVQLVLDGNPVARFRAAGAR
jgi:hypothetical protein